jgi:hypothetical protein
MQPQTETDMAGKQLKNKFSSLKKAGDISTAQLAIFVLAFGLIGYLIFKSFAASPLVTSFEAEQMVLPNGGSIITDTTASAGKAVKLASNGTATGSVNFPSSVTSLSVIAKGAQCSGAPAMTITLDGSNLMTNTAVSSTSWTAYSVTPSATLNSGSHSLAVSFTNDYTSAGHGKKGNGACSRDLYLDVTNFYGPAPVILAPTITLSASPSTVTAGQSSTLTWNSTNATGCTASGAWSGSQPTSGSVSTGALNQNSTYSLNCTGSGGSASASASVVVSATTTASKIYWGAYVEAAQTYNYLYGGTWSNAPWCDSGTQCGLPKYTSNAGKAPSIEHWGQCWTCSFDSSIASVVVQRGDIPSIDWRTSGVSNSAVASGQYDTQILNNAKAIAAWGHPLFLEFDVEMNGTWYDYSPGQLGNTAASFVSMWRHVHDLYQQAGANNVTWVWAPNVDPNHQYTSYASMYPGDSYVDWTGVDGYNWGTAQGNVWQTFSQVFQTSYNDLKTVAPTKPIMINEFASEELGGSKASWITDALTSQLPNNFPQIKAIQWFNWRIFEKNAYWNWEMESSPSSQQAFAQGIASSYYAPGGTYGSLPLGTKVPTP